MLGFIFGGNGREEGIMLALSHSEKGDSGPPPNITIIEPCTLVTVTGEDEESCSSLLLELKLKCMELGNQSGETIRVGKVVELMAETLYSRHEIALVAGWEFAIDVSPYKSGPSLYRIDGTGILIQGKTLDSGNGIGYAYASMDNKHMRPVVPLPGNENYEDRSVWSVESAAYWAKRVMCKLAADTADAFVSVFRVGSDGWQRMDHGIDAVAYAKSNKIMVSRSEIMAPRVHSSAYLQYLFP